MGTHLKVCEAYLKVKREQDERQQKLATESGEGNASNVVLAKGWSQEACRRACDYMHVRCCAHILNLIVLAGLKELHASVASIRNAVKYVRSSTSRLKAFKECVDHVKGSNGTVVLDCITRWNSTYLMLMTALKFREAFERMAEVDKPHEAYFKEEENGKKKVGPPRLEDWEHAERIVRFLKIFYDATLTFSTSLSVTSNLCYNTIDIIKNSLSALEKNKDVYVHLMAFSMRETYDKYWEYTEKINKILIIASIFDPRCEMDFTKHIFSMIFFDDSAKIEEMVAVMKGLLNSLFDAYFDFKDIAPDQQVQLASFHLEGIALQWQRWLMKFRGPLSWEEFTKAVLLRFGPTDYEDPSEALSRLKQTTTVAAYQEAFEKLSYQIDGLPQHFLVGCFVAGLRDDVRLDVKIKQPRTLVDAIGVARLVEEQNLLQRKARTSYPFQTTTVMPRTMPNTTASVLGLPPTQKNQNSSNTPISFRRITNQEARERREKGLCYYCDEKFVPGHRCERPQLFMIEDSPQFNCTNDEDAQHVPEHYEVIPEVSFHAIAGTTHPQTIRVQGKLKNKDVTVLIDGGSTHNFTDQAIVSKFGLPVVCDKKLQVMVANREQIECAGQCQGLTLTVQGHPITADYFILPVAACQLVLGVQWLETLRPIETDYKKLTMTFRKREGIHTFQGMERAGMEALTGKEFLNLQGTGFFFQIMPANNNKKLNEYPPDLICLLNEFCHVFQPPSGLPPKRTHDHQIPLEPNTKPVSVRPYRYPYYQKNEIEKMVKELLQAGLVRPSSNPFLSPVLLVKKADGSWRFCVDYRALNTITVKDKYPIPVIDELLDELHGAKFFSKLDLRAGYHQIRVKEEDVSKIAFRTHEGHYEFLVMPFGLTNAPATFQSLMNDLFRPYLRRTWEDHLSHLRQVLDILSTNSLFAKESKCQFGVLQVEYLGHIISEKGVAVDPVKIQTVIDWPTPTTTKGVRGFLGLAGYYRKFIRNFGCIAAPLTRLLTKEGFHWNKDAVAAFDQLKTALTSPHVLRLPDFSQRFVIECDASGIGIGAILSQQNRPVAYFSEALKGSALALSTYEKKMLAIVKSIRKWRPYLLGKPFTIRTDQKSIKYLLEQRITTPAQTRWLLKILGYDYEIEYKRGAENQGANSLS
ncbi:uncharacterized protein LOC127903656 [Citrus sinensis]|uniref:uncharacterized protein LOC127903656 n=1 Tax=Citrus sinensis TaxID=2711 RepID=UPI002277E55A|nr:uncharacterized protein LOC127903656 [Citrus sinensis]